MSKNAVKSNIVSLAKKLGRLEMIHFEAEKALKGFASPNKKIFDLVKSGELLKVKRGVYRLNSELIESIKPSEEILAQLLHGPSYISSEWALAYYGLIPEMVPNVTSVTIGRKMNIKTSAGIFEYQHLPLEKYSFGFLEEKIHRNSFLLATPLKAVVDLVYFRLEKKEILSEQDKIAFFESNYRIDTLSLCKKISFEELITAKKIYKRVSSVNQILDYIYKFGGFK